MKKSKYIFLLIVFLLEGSILSALKSAGVITDSLITELISLVIIMIPIYSMIIIALKDENIKAKTKTILYGVLIFLSACILVSVGVEIFDVDVNSYLENSIK